MTMATRRTAPATVATPRQAAQQDLLAAALKRPGVAAASEVYNQAQRYAQPLPSAASTRVGYATGANG